MSNIEIPHGYCHCGCGQQTNLVKNTLHAQNRIKGQPSKFVEGHNNSFKFRPCQTCGTSDRYGNGACKECKRIYGAIPEVRQKSHIRTAARNRRLSTNSELVNHIIWCKQQSCSYCGNPGGQHDHVVPISRGGPHSIENIVSCCQRCNDTKQSRTPDEWVDRWYSDGAC